MKKDIKDKIAKLLALAESPEPEEAKAALLRARELMAKYKLRPEECQKAEDMKVVRGLTGVTCTALTNPWAVSLSAVIAEHYCCRAYRNREYAGQKTNEIGLVGLEDDFAVAKRIFLYAYESVIAGMKHSIRRNTSDPAGTYREKCNAYGWGFIMGLKQAYQDQDAEHQEWGLVMVVPQAVDDSMKDMGKKTPFGKIRGVEGGADCRALGYKAGREFDPSSRLSTGQKLAALKGAKA